MQAALFLNGRSTDRTGKQLDRAIRGAALCSIPQRPVPEVSEQGLDGTVVLYLGEALRLLLRFEDYTDLNMPCMYR